MLTTVCCVLTDTHYLRIEKQLANLTRESGDNVRLKCEFTGTPLPKVSWYKNEAPVETEKGRVQTKVVNVAGTDRVRARLHISRLDTHDTGYYKCEADNDLGLKAESVGVLIVKADNSANNNNNNAGNNNNMAGTVYPSMFDFEKAAAGPGPMGQYPKLGPPQAGINTGLYE